MKKTGVVFCIAAALLTLINASVWEGAASRSTGGDLPDTGYYVASNSFPRNTVVDITNLENGKTIRAIVSAPLANPGLLAVLSKNAADAIGLPSRSIGRVRMNQPVDPVAFSRFSEGSSGSGDPDHDPAAFVAANGINPELLAGGAETAGAIPPGEDPPSAARAPEETEAAGDESLEDMTIVDIPEGYVPPASPEPDTKREELVEPKPEDRAEVTDAVTGNTGAPAEQLTEAAENSAIVEPREARSGDAPRPDERAENFPGDYDLTLVPSEDRPPESAEPFIPAVRIFPPAAGTETALTPSPSGRESAPSLPAGPAETARNYGFPVPVITKLEEGKYYLQLAASSNQYTVRMELEKIGSTLPLAVQNAGSAEKPIYRILVGPVNLGESGALLQRFRTSYKDAFVRQGR
ncbi:MAG: hypothetical protein LBP23_01100 [Treponema sp.]|jgi:hypothetical protein|nr:hypothetical protein [Treponema sp.]